jgi:hypothetical protein
MTGSAKQNASPVPANRSSPPIRIGTRPVNCHPLCLARMPKSALLTRSAESPPPLSERLSAAKTSSWPRAVTQEDVDRETHSVLHGNNPRRLYRLSGRLARWLFSRKQEADGALNYGDFIAEVGAMAMGSTSYEWILDAPKTSASNTIDIRVMKPPSRRCPRTKGEPWDQIGATARAAIYGYLERSRNINEDGYQDNDDNDPNPDRHAIPFLRGPSRPIVSARAASTTSRSDRPSGWVVGAPSCLPSARARGLHATSPKWRSSRYLSARGLGVLLASANT